jgi:hypothetical protein
MLIGTVLGRAGSSTHVLIAVVAVACAPSGEERAREAADTWSVSSEPLITIGRLEGDPRYLFEQIAGARLLPDGRVVVADRGFGSVRVYGPDGSFQQEMGRPGQGPGEFEYISSISLFPPDTIVVYDSSRYRLVTYSPDGTLLSTRNIRGEGGWPESFVGRFENGDLGLAWIVRTQREPMTFATDVMQFGRFSPEGLLRALLATATGMVRHEDGIMGMMPFSPRLHSFLYRDSVYFTDGLGDIAVAGGNGAVARTIEVPIDPVDYGEARAQLAARMETADVDLRPPVGFLERLDLVQELNEAPEPESVPRVAEVLLDDEGRFWLKRYEPASDSHVISSFERRAGGEWWVLQPDGRVVAVIQLPDGFTPMDVRGERIVGVASDELDVERVLVFGTARGD